jgi:hypothetical protein
MDRLSALDVSFLYLEEPSTAAVTDFAGDSVGGIVTAGRQGGRYGAAFSRSSVFTYSAVARVSTSSVTR